ncbi:MAG: M14 family zinc carboxypeptidase, partial [Bacteroidota bacterium]
MIRKNCDRTTWIVFWIVCSALIMIFQGVYAQEGKTPFYPNGKYARGIPTPDEVIGFSLGERPVRYDETIRYLKTLAEKSPRVRLVESGETHEKRKLYYLLVSSEGNLARLDGIQEGISKLADPRKAESEDQAQKIIDTTPAIVWMMYSIHGEELSGTDASLQLAYQVAAGTDPATENIR